MTSGELLECFNSSMASVIPVETRSTKPLFHCHMQPTTMTQLPKRQFESQTRSGVSSLSSQLGVNFTLFPLSTKSPRTTPTMDLTTEEGIQQYLRSNHYPSCQHIERLPEGFGGFVFRAHIENDGKPSTIIVKHVEPYAARSTSWKLDQSRLVKIVPGTSPEINMLTTALGI